MANNVSDVSVRLSTDPQRFIQGFEQARSSVAPLAAAVNNLNTSLTSFNLGGFAGRFATIAAPLQNLASNLASRNFAGAAVDGINLASSLASIGSEALRAAAGQIRLADQLGTTQESFQGLQLLATRFGLDMEEVTHGVSKFNSRIGELRVGLSRGEVPPLAIALRNMGIDAQRFSELRTNQQLLEIARALERIPNIQDRRFALSQLFGEREALVFQRLLSRGPQELLNSENEAIRRGLVLYGERRQAVEDASRAQRELNAEIENSWNALGREVGVMTSPLARSATNSVRPGTIENDFWAYFFGAFVRQTPSIPFKSDTIQQAREFEDSRLALKRIKMDFGTPIAEQLGSQTSQTNQATDRFGENIRNTNAAAQELLLNLQRQGAAIGLSAAEAEIYRRNLDEINPLLANQIREQERINEQNQQQVSQAQQVRQRFEQARPLFSFQLEMQRIRNNNRLNPEDRRFAAFDAIQRLESSLPRFTTQYAGAFQMGSAEAVSAITQARAQQMDSQMSPQQRLEVLFERSLMQETRQAEVMQGIFDALMSRGIAVAPQA